MKSCTPGDVTAHWPVIKGVIRMTSKQLLKEGNSIKDATAIKHEG